LERIVARFKSLISDMLRSNLKGGGSQSGNQQNSTPKTLSQPLDTPIPSSQYSIEEKRSISKVKRCVFIIICYIPFLLFLVFIIFRYPNGMKSQSSTNIGSVSTAPMSRDEKGTCEIVTPVFANRTTTALASYPGSGNTMTRILIEALTGVWTGSTHGNPKMIGKQVRSVGNPADDRLTENVVVVKTHQPDVKPLRWKDAKRVIFIIRDPLSAIPSAHNAKWEVGSKIKMHTGQAPEISWINWRDSFFDLHLRKWRTTLQYWNTQYSYPGKRIVVVYEDLVHNVTGPIIAEKIMTFLGQGIIPLKDVPCIWQKVVRGSAEKVHRPRKYTPKFKSEHMLRVISDLDKLLNTTTDEPNLLRALTRYKNNAQKRLENGSSCQVGC